MARVFVLLPERRKRSQGGELRLPKVVTDLALAEQFQGLLKTGKVKNRAELARRFRLTRARVTQLMKLLGLHPLIIAYVKSLQPGTPTRLVTERGLRVVLRVSGTQQLATALQTVPGFRVYIDSKTKSVA